MTCLSHDLMCQSFLQQNQRLTAISPMFLFTLTSLQQPWTSPSSPSVKRRQTTRIGHEFNNIWKKFRPGLFYIVAQHFNVIL